MKTTTTTTSNIGNKLNAAKAAKRDALRQEAIKRYLANVNDPGRYGRVWELICTPSLSNKAWVSGANIRDTYIRVRGTDEKIRNESIECKVNGGRVDALLKSEFLIAHAYTGSKYVAYRYVVDIKHKATKNRPEWTEHRELPGVLIPVDIFVTALQSDKSFLKAIAHDGIQDGIAIQASSKKWYKRLAAYVDNYPDLIVEPEKIYESWQFEGVEL